MFFEIGKNDIVAVGNALQVFDKTGRYLGVDIIPMISINQGSEYTDDFTIHPNSMQTLLGKVQNIIDEDKVDLKLGYEANSKGIHMVFTQQNQSFSISSFNVLVGLLDGTLKKNISDIATDRGFNVPDRWKFGA